LADIVGGRNIRHDALRVQMEKAEVAAFLA